jgi:hypothetical protein
MRTSPVGVKSGLRRKRLDLPLHLPAPLSLGDLQVIAGRVVGSSEAVSLVDFLTSVHDRKTASCFAFSVMLGESGTELFELTEA